MTITTFFLRVRLLISREVTSLPSASLLPCNTLPMSLPPHQTSHHAKTDDCTTSLFHHFFVFPCQSSASRSKPDIKEIAWASSFKKHCLNRDSCVMLHTKAGKYKAPDWFKQLMAKHRALR